MNVRHVTCDMRFRVFNCTQTHLSISSNANFGIDLYVAMSRSKLTSKHLHRLVTRASATQRRIFRANKTKTVPKKNRDERYCLRAVPTAGSVQLNRTDGDEQTHLDERGFSAAVAADDADATVEIDAKVNLRKKKRWAEVMHLRRWCSDCL